MNWFTNRVNVKVTDGIHNVCEHLEVGDVAARVVYENDGLGEPESSAMCSACYDAHKAAEDEVLEICYDCGQERPMRVMINWRAYDDYPSEGGDGIHVCDDCRPKPKHRERVRKDREDYEREMDYLNDN